MAETPVQIIRMEALGGGRAQFLLDEPLLRPILEAAGDEDVYLIAAAGMSRLGKSCFLNYVAKYLMALENGDKQIWMRKEDTMAVTGFEFSNTVEPQTIGFWLWPRPFHILHNGTTVSVFLMDTQGVFDTNDQSLWTSIVGLTLLTSNCFIYNLNFTANHESLIVLDSYLQFGKMLRQQGAETNVSTLSPFNRFFCILRDWASPGVYPYGIAGGNNFMRNRWLSKEGKDDDQIRIIDNFNACFKTPACFLMPAPNAEVLSQSFNGSPSSMCDMYFNSLKSAVQEVCTPKYLTERGTQPTSRDHVTLLAKFEEFVNVINQNETLQPADIFNATDRIACVSTRKREMDNFISCWKTYLNSIVEKYPDPSSFESWLANLKEKAENKFSQLRVGCLELKAREFDLFSSELNQETERLCIEFKESLDNKIVKIEDSIVNKVSTNVRHKMETIGSLEGCISQDQLKTIYQESVTEALASSCTAVLSNCGNYYNDVFQKDLQNKFKRLRNDLQRENKQALAAIEEELGKYSESALLRYGKEMKESQLHTEFLLPEDLHRIHQNAADVANKYVSRLGLKKSVQHKVAKKLEGLVEKEYGEIKGNNKTKRRLVAESIDAAKQIMLLNFTDKMKRAIDQNAGEAETEFRLQQLEQTGKLRTTLCRYKPEFMQPYLDCLSKEMKEVYDKLLVDKQRAFEEEYRQATHRLDALAEGYMQKLTLGEKMLTVPELMAFCKKEEEIVRKQAIDGLTSRMTNLLTNFDLRLEGHSSRFIENCRDRLDVRTKEAIEQRKLIAENYKTLLKISIGSGTLGGKSREEKIKAFEKDFIDVPDDMRKAMVEDLATDMDNCEQNQARDDEFRKSTLSSWVLGAVDDYKKHMMEQCTNWNYVSEVRMADEKCREKIVQSLHTNERVSKITSSEIDTYKQQFNQQVKSTYLHHLQNVQTHIVNKLIALQVTDFERDVEKLKFGSKIPKREQLEVALISCTKKGLKKISAEEIPAEVQEAGIKNLERLLKEVFNNVVRQFSCEQQKILTVFKTNWSDEIGRTEGDYARHTLESCTWDRVYLEKRIGDFTVAKIGNLSALKQQFSRLQDEDIDPGLNDLKCMIQRVNGEWLSKIHRIEEVLSKTIRFHSEALKERLDEEPDPNWTVEKAQYLEHLNDKTKNVLNELSLIPCPLKTALESHVQNIAEKAITEIRRTFVAKEPIEATIRLAKETAVRTYNEEMEKHKANAPHHNIEGLLRYHKSAEEQALNGTSRICPLTKAVRKTLLSAIKNEYAEMERNFILDKEFATQAVGIDLGTTFSCVAIYRNGKAEVVPNMQDKNTTPSYVLIQDGAETAGNSAKEMAFQNPGNTIFDAKRLIGQRFMDPNIQRDIPHWPFKVESCPDGNPEIVVDGRRFKPEAISTMVLKKLKEDAEKKLSKEIRNVVITVPAYFNGSQKQATREAGIAAGLNVLQLLTEPVAAALAYNMQFFTGEEKTVLVFDLGGGTFDVALLKMKKGDVSVIGLDGDTHLGGEDFDSNLMHHCVREFHKVNPNINLYEGKDSPTQTEVDAYNRRIRRLRQQCENQKIVLSEAPEVTIAVDAMADGVDLAIKVARGQFEELNKDLFAKCIQKVEHLLTRHNAERGSISEIVMVGGSSRIPKIREMLGTYFNQKALCSRINPDEAVAQGASIMAAVLNGKLQLNVKEATPLPIGIEVLNGEMSVIIPRDTHYPKEIQKNYTTTEDNQTAVPIEIYEGESDFVANNNLLGTFGLKGIPPLPKGKAKVLVKMMLDADGILTVTATCGENGITEALTIEDSRANKFR